MDRVRTATKVGAPLEPSAQAPMPALTLDALWTSVLQATGVMDRRRAAEALASALAKAPRSDDLGQLLLAWVEKGVLLPAPVTHVGLSLRALGLETLFRLGFPWALQVHPDELKWLQDFRRRQRGMLWGSVLGAAAALVVAGVALSKVL